LGDLLDRVEQFMLGRWDGADAALNLTLHDCYLDSIAWTRESMQLMRQHADV